MGTALALGILQSNLAGRCYDRNALSFTLVPGADDILGTERRPPHVKPPGPLHHFGAEPTAAPSEGKLKTAHRLDRRMYPTSHMLRATRPYVFLASTLPSNLEAFGGEKRVVIDVGGRVSLECLNHDRNVLRVAAGVANSNLEHRSRYCRRMDHPFQGRYCRTRPSK